MEGSVGRSNQQRDLLLAKDRRKAMALFRIGHVSQAPGPLECLAVKEPQGSQTHGDAAWWKLPFLKQHCLVFANMPRAQTIGSAVEVPSKISNCMDVRTYGILRIIKTLEFFQHHFSKLGHRDLLVTQTYLNGQAQLLRSSREASAARRLRSNRGRLGLSVIDKL